MCCRKVSLFITSRSVIPSGERDPGFCLRQHKPGFLATARNDNSKALHGKIV
jgi:hypothetical protein